MDLVWRNKNVFRNVRKELDRLRKLLAKAKEEAIGSETIIGLGSCRGILMCFWIGKQQCGLNGLGCCGQGMETKIQNTSIVKQLKDTGEI